MPVKTPHFELKAFVTGDEFSATVDRRRMKQIDNHFAFLSDLVGSGVIEGWELSEDSPLVLECSAGMGIIDRFVTRTIGPYTKSLLDNNIVYVWMKRRPGVIGQTSAFSDISFLEHEDATPPNVPTGLAVISSTISSLSLTWNAISDIDFSVFKIFKSTDNIDFEFVSDSSTNSYIDIGLDNNTAYYYRLSSVDKTGNESVVSSSLIALTDTDLTPPSDPSTVEVTSADEAFHLIWRPAFGDIGSYKAEVTPISIEGIVKGDVFYSSVSGTTLFMTVGNLSNGQRYKVTLKSVGVNGVESEGVTVSVTPDVFNGPKDILDLVLYDKKGDGVISDIILTVDWSPFIDPYDSSPAAVSYEIQISELDGENGGEIVSEFIEVPEGTSREFKLYPYSDTEFGIVNRSIRERTKYFVLIRAIDNNGLRSVGKVGVYTTRSFKSPNAPTQLGVSQQDDRSLIFTWVNSVSIFANNILTIRKVDENDPSNTEVLVDEKDIGFSKSYIVEPSDIEAGVNFEFTIKAIDEFGNESAEAVDFFSIPDFDDLEAPPVPSQQFGVSGDKQNTIVWNNPNVEFFSGFNIYRSEEQVVYASSNFIVAETVDSETFEFLDYDVENDVNYVYFITTIDIYGRESLNPIQDLFFDYDLVSLTPSRTGDLPEPTGLILSVIGLNPTDIDLTWNVTSGQFDGYEIYRSFNNKFSFEKIGTVSPSITSFIDINVLDADGTYYYMVRKFRNEADLFVTESNSTVVGSLFLGKVTTENGNMAFDVVDVRNIKDLEDPVKEETQSRLIVHKHSFFTEIDDRRINLADTLVITNWTTNDFQNYFTETDITESTTFTVFLDGEKPENLDIFFTIEKTLGRITFEKRLARGDLLADDDESFQFDDPPTVSVIFDNLTEVQKTLPAERLDGASAQQVSVGLVQEFQLPDLDHEGRIKEKILPIQEEFFAVDDGYRFAPVDSSVPQVGKALTWYFIILAEGQDGDVLVASTSDGLYTSEDFGLTWVLRFTPITPIIRLFYSPTYDFYFALTNRGVLGSGGGSSGGFSAWSEIRGMENAKVARDIVEDNNGEVFCSADIGVFKLIKDVGRGSFFWEQTPVFGPKSTESFAMLYDDDRDRVIVSNELGIFETPNAGVRWDFSDEFPEQRNIFSFFKDGTTIYALTRFMVWRMKLGEIEFKRMAVFDDVEISRRIVVWKDRIFVTTDLGVLVSVPGSDIENDETIEFELAFAQMNRGDYISPPTSMNIVDDKLFVGTEERLFVATSPGKISLQSEIILGVIPTVYINGEEQRIGVRYTTGTDRLKKFITFDVKIDVGSVITVANQYKNYQSTFKGWAGSDYAAKVFCYIDGSRINDGSISEKPAVNISNIVWPTFNDRNANSITAQSAFNDVLNKQVSLLLLSDDQQNPELTSFNKENTRQFIYKTERFLSQIYINARVIPELNSDGNTIFVDSNGSVISEGTPGAIQKTVPFILPEFKVVLLSSNKNFEKNNIVSEGIYNKLFNGESGIGSLGSELEEDGSFGNIGEQVDDDNSV